MPDFDRLDGIAAVARVISRIPTGNKQRPHMGTPAAVLGMWATELYDDFGVRVHPDLATHELVRVDQRLGNHSPVQKVAKGTPARLGENPEVKRMQAAHSMLLDWMRSQDDHPELSVLADRVVAAQGDPVKSAVLLGDIRREHPEVWDKGQELLAKLQAERPA